MIMVSLCAAVAWALRTRLGVAVFGFTFLPLALLWAFAVTCFRLGERLQLSQTTAVAVFGVVCVALGALLLYIATLGSIVAAGMWWIAIAGGTNASR